MDLEEEDKISKYLSENEVVLRKSGGIFGIFGIFTSFMQLIFFWPCRVSTHDVKRLCALHMETLDLLIFVEIHAGKCFRT